MKTLQVKISERDYSKYNFARKGELTFVELEELISMEYAKKSLDKNTKIAKQTKLSKMTMDEVNNEIKAARDLKKEEKKSFKEQTIKNIKSGLKEVQLFKNGKLKTTSAKDFLNEL